MQSVGNKSTAILVPIIAEEARPGSIIWSDEWCGYNPLLSTNFEPVELITV